jgi:hypothetical protein
LIYAIVWHGLRETPSALEGGLQETSPRPPESLGRRARRGARPAGIQRATASRDWSRRRARSDPTRLCGCSSRCRSSYATHWRPTRGPTPVPGDPLRLGRSRRKPAGQTEDFRISGYKASIGLGRPDARAATPLSGRECPSAPLFRLSCRRRQLTSSRVGRTLNALSPTSPVCRADSESGRAVASSERTGSVRPRPLTVGAGSCY